MAVRFFGGLTYSIKHLRPVVPVNKFMNTGMTGSERVSVQRNHVIPGDATDILKGRTKISKPSN